MQLIYYYNILVSQARRKMDGFNSLIGATTLSMKTFSIMTLSI
jgi:hypothetical protein